MKNRNKASSLRGVAQTLLPLLVIGTIIGIGIANYIEATATCCKPNCVANLRRLDDAKQQWAIDNKLNGTDTPTDTDLFGTDLYLKIKPTCPQGGHYTLRAVNEWPTCCLAAELGHNL